MTRTILAGVLCLVMAVNAIAQQTLTLKSGEKLNGKVESLLNDEILFNMKGKSVKYKTEEVISIVFNESSQGAGAMPREAGEKSIVANNAVVRYKVADRTVTKPPVINNLTQEKGTVVVNITIDKYGHVRKAVPGGDGSSTKSTYLWTKAQQAAESALFDNVPNAPLEQKGYMIITF